MTTKRVFQLSGTCNNYPWGKQGRQSLAAQLCARTPGTGFEIDDGQYYSEMWFGDYPDFPARVLETGEPLADVLRRDQQGLLGKKVVETMDGQLPFLPKILSIAKALPLQLHPDKDLATKLHTKDPSQFTDPNHKPEIAVALSKFELFAGFKPLDQIEPLFTLPALSPYSPTAGQKGAAWDNEALRAATRALLSADEATTKKIESDLLATPHQDLAAAGGEYILDLLPRLQGQYGPGDAGTVVAVACMNFLTLQPLDAVYIPADGIHAYLSGNIVECMARSNNVLNAGFCPRAERDSVDLFAETLTFKSHSREDVMLPRQKSEMSKTGRTEVYKPPMSEFDMLVAGLRAGEGDVLEAGEGPGVLIVTQGTGRMGADGAEFELKEGFIYFVAPGVEVELETESGMQVFMATV